LSGLEFTVCHRLNQFAMGPENLSAASEIVRLRRVDVLKSIDGHNNANRPINWVDAFDPHPKANWSSIKRHVFSSIKRQNFPLNCAS